MNRNFVKIVVLSVYRRRKSMWKVVFLSFLCVFLFGGIMIFQDVMNRFQRENTLKKGGNWFVAAEEKSKLIREHAYFDREGSMVVRTKAEYAGEIGAADRNFFKQSKIKIYEGRLPESEDEVAMTRKALSGLGAKLEVGQKIELNYDSKRFSDGLPVFISKEVTVTGILSSYTENWVGGLICPEVFFTEEGLENLDVKDEEEQRTYFYSLKPEQIDVDGRQLYEKLQGMLSEQGEHISLIYNQESYDVTMWGSQNMYYMAMVLCALLGSMSLIYLFSGCLHDRRSSYFRYLELGMTKGQLRQMIGIEWGTVFLPTACAALIGSLVITGIAAKILSVQYDIPNIFYLTGQSLLLIILFTFGVFFLVFMWCCLGFRVKGLYEMTGQIPVKRLKHLQKKRDARFGGLVLFEKRRGRMYPGKALVRTLFTIVALSIVMYMSLLWRDRYQENCVAVSMADIIGGVEIKNTVWGGLIMIDGEGRLKYNQEILEDDTVSEEEKEEKRCEVRLEEPIHEEIYATNLSSGLTEEEKEEIQKIQGVQNVRGESVARDLKLDWENSKHSEFRINCYIKDWLSTPFTLLMGNKSQLAEGEYEKAFGMIPNDLACYKYLFYGLEKNSATDRELRRCSKEFDSDAFWAGEQGVLFAIPDQSNGMEEEEGRELECVLSYDDEKQEYRFQGKSGQKYQYSFQENTLHSGDEISILDREKEELLSASVVVSDNRECYRRILESVAEIYEENGYVNGYRQVFPDRGYFFLGSENMMEKLAAKQGKDLSYHILNVWLEKGADKEKVEKQVAELFSKYRCAYQSTLEYKGNVQEALDRQRIISVTVILLVVCCYFFIMQTMEKKEMEQIKGQLQLLLEQGAWKQDILKVRALFHSRGYLWGIFCIPLCGLWTGIGKWTELLDKNKGTEIKADIGEFLAEFIAEWGEQMRDVWLWGIFAFLVIAVVLFTLVSEWNCLKKMK